MKRILLIGMIGFALTGCVEKVSEVTEYRELEITNINPPKHMYVDLYDKERDKFYPQEYVSKRCSNWERVQSGTVMSLKVRTVKYADGTERADIDAGPVCPR
jgi:hypothetical protein